MSSKITLLGGQKEFPKALFPEKVRINAWEDGKNFIFSGETRSTFLQDHSVLRFFSRMSYAFLWAGSALSIVPYLIIKKMSIAADTDFKQLREKAIAIFAKATSPAAAKASAVQSLSQESALQFWRVARSKDLGRIVSAVLQNLKASPAFQKLNHTQQESLMSQLEKALYKELIAYVGINILGKQPETFRSLSKITHLLVHKHIASSTHKAQKLIKVELGQYLSKSEMPTLFKKHHTSHAPIKKPKPEPVPKKPILDTPVRHKTVPMNPGVNRGEKKTDHTKKDYDFDHNFSLYTKNITVFTDSINIVIENKEKKLTKCRDGQVMQTNLMFEKKRHLSAFKSEDVEKTYIKDLIRDGNSKLVATAIFEEYLLSKYENTSKLVDAINQNRHKLSLEEKTLDLPSDYQTLIQEIPELSQSLKKLEDQASEIKKHYPELEQALKDRYEKYQRFKQVTAKDKPAPTPTTGEVFVIPKKEDSYLKKLEKLGKYREHIEEKIHASITSLDKDTLKYENYKKDHPGDSEFSLNFYKPSSYTREKLNNLQYKRENAEARKIAFAKRIQRLGREITVDLPGFLASKGEKSALYQHLYFNVLRDVVQSAIQETQNTLKALEQEANALRIKAEESKNRFNGEIDKVKQKGEEEQKKYATLKQNIATCIVYKTEELDLLQKTLPSKPSATAPISIPASLKQPLAELCAQVSLLRDFDPYFEEKRNALGISSARILNFGGPAAKEMREKQRSLENKLKEKQVAENFVKDIWQLVRKRAGNSSSPLPESWKAAYFPLKVARLGLTDSIPRPEVFNHQNTKEALLNFANAEDREQLDKALETLKKECLQEQRKLIDTSTQEIATLDKEIKKLDSEIKSGERIVDFQDKQLEKLKQKTLLEIRSDLDQSLNALEENLKETSFRSLDGLFSALGFTGSPRQLLNQEIQNLQRILALKSQEIPEVQARIKKIQTDYDSLYKGYSSGHGINGHEAEIKKHQDIITKAELSIDKYKKLDQNGKNEDEQMFKALTEALPVNKKSLQYHQDQKALLLQDANTKQAECKNAKAALKKLEREREQLEDAHYLGAQLSVFKNIQELLENKTANISGLTTRVSRYMEMLVEFQNFDPKLEEKLTQMKVDSEKFKSENKDLERAALKEIRSKLKQQRTEKNEYLNRMLDLGDEIETSLKSMGYSKPLQTLFNETDSQHIALHQTLKTTATREVLEVYKTFSRTISTTISLDP